MKLVKKCLWNALNGVGAKSIGVGSDELSDERHRFRHEELDELDARLAEAGRLLGAVGLSDEEVDDSVNVFLGFDDLSQFRNSLLAKVAGDGPCALCL